MKVAHTPEEVDPRPRAVAIGSFDGVHHGHRAVLAAVVHRLRTGEGQHVEVPMLESVVSFNLLDHLYEKTYLPAIGTTGYARQLDPERQPMRTRDGYIVVAPYQDGRWVRFFEIAGRMDVLQEPGLTDWVLRRTNATRLYQHMKAILPLKTTDEWLALLSAAGIPATRVNDLDDLLDDPQLQAAGLFAEREHPTEGRYIELKPPVRFSAHDYVPPRPAPLTGQHTVEVAQELGVRIEASPLDAVPRVVVGFDDGKSGAAA